MDRYVAFLHKRNSGGWGVSFPDFPGCIATGDDWNAAAENAAEALQFHVEGLLEDKVAIPAPRSPEELLADRKLKENVKGAIITLVPLLPPAGKPERINITVDSNLLRTIDDAANA